MLTGERRIEGWRLLLGPKRLLVFFEEKVVAFIDAEGLSVETRLPFHILRVVEAMWEERQWMLDLATSHQRCKERPPALNEVFISPEGHRHVVKRLFPDGLLETESVDDGAEGGLMGSPHGLFLPGWRREP